MNGSKIKVGYLISYDYKYMTSSLPTVYKNADLITLAIDKDRKTWGGESFEIPDSFFEWIKQYDTEKKISIYEDSFYLSKLSVMECDTRERNMLGEFMGHGGWHIQIDTDEYFFDFESFCNYLRSLDIDKDTAVYAEWITIFKQEKSHTFLINSNEIFPIATNSPRYKKARQTEDFQNIYTKFKVLHQSWGRTEIELNQKLKNWSHSGDFNTEAYFNLWKAINKDTYKYIQNFHPLDFHSWKSLIHIEAKDIPELIEKTKATLLFEKQENKKSKFLSFFSCKKKK